MPGENDPYEKSIKAAVEVLEHKFSLWQEDTIANGIPQPQLVQRFAFRDQLQKSALRQISLKVHELYAELLAAHESIKLLEARVLSLELRLQMEKEVRQKLEENLKMLVLELERIINPPNKTLNKIGAITTLWFLERLLKLKHHGFHFDRVVNDLKAKSIVGFFGSRPVQKIFGIPAGDARSILSKTDFFIPED